MGVHGIAVVKGVAVGKAQTIINNYAAELESYVQEDNARELKKYTKALEKAKDTLDELLNKMNDESSANEKAILTAHQMILEDYAFMEAITRFISEGYSAPSSIQNAVKEMEEMFSSVEDPYLRERVADAKDVGNRLLRTLFHIGDIEIEDDAVIIYAQDIEPSVMAGLPETKVKGVLLGNGSKTSHSVIIAKSKGFVTLVGVDFAQVDFQSGDMLIVDGDSQQVIVNPVEDMITEYKATESEQQKNMEYYLERSGLSAVTPEGKEILVAANISQPHDIDNGKKYGCRGVGLYRTEFLYMQSKQLPTEEEQYEAYKYVVENAEGQLCVIRTLDIGGDKPAEALMLEQEANPFLGWRAIRICLQNRELFRCQIKAILRAGVHGKAAMMIPMVISLKEVIETKKIIAEAKSELDKENKPFVNELPIGIMIETPAAAIMAPVLAQHVDFFSIGTNDLVQYTLAVDRGNQKVNYLYDYFNPAVIRSIYQIITAAHSNNIWVGICGEMASDELSIPLLLALGVDELSMSATLAPKIKEVIRHTGNTACDMDRVLAMTDEAEVRDFLSEINRTIMGDIYQAGKTIG